MDEDDEVEEEEQDELTGEEMAEIEREYGFEEDEGEGAEKVTDDMTKLKLGTANDTVAATSEGTVAARSFSVDPRA